jgi:hypothetical protein
MWGAANSRGFTPGWYVTRFQRWGRAAGGGGRAREDPPSPRPSVVRLPPSQSLRRDMKAGRLRALQGAIAAESGVLGRRGRPSAGHGHGHGHETGDSIGRL